LAYHMGLSLCKNMGKYLSLTMV